MEIPEKLKQRELVNTKCLIIKMSFKFLFKTVGICDHLKFTWETVPLCWIAERKCTFAKFCTQSRFQVTAAAAERKPGRRIIASFPVERRI